MNNKHNINILFNDDDFIVISKPSGLLTIPDRYDKNAENLKGILTKIYGKIFIVHRLDKDTSGVMIFAKNSYAHQHLNSQFESNQVKKIYHVVVAGTIQKDKINVDIPLIHHTTKKGMMAPSARGKPSLTKIKILERFRHATLIECDLVTGRQHQIRVHCSAIGYPLLVDELYGSSDKFYLSTIKRRYNVGKDSFEKPVISRLSMHSYSIKFVHPRINKKIELIAEYPRDMKALVQILRKYSKY